MINTVRIAGWLFAGIVFANACFAQEEQPKPGPPPLRFYRLEFVVKELENDKVINSRAYSTTLSNTREGSSIRSGSRVPYVTGSPTSKQVQYYEIGVNIDVREARELPSGLLMVNLNIDVSSVLVTKEASGEEPPAVRNTKWSSPVVVQTKKTTTVFSSDDPSGNRKMQLDLTATPIT